MRLQSCPGPVNLVNPSEINPDMLFVRVVDRVRSGDKLIWDRPAGILRIGAVWGASAGNGSTLDLIPAKIVIDPGETYYFHYFFHAHFPVQIPSVSIILQKLHVLL